MEIWALRNNSNEPTEMLKQAKFDSRIDTDLLVGKIIEVCGNMTPVHNTTDSFLYFHKLFFKMWEKQISKLLDTMDYEYEPLDNYRRTEKLILNANENITGNNKTSGSNTNNESTTVTDNYKDSSKSSSTSNSSGSESNSSNTSNNESSSSSDSSTAEDKTSAYNESIYQPESQTIKSGTANGSKNSSSESSGSSSSSNESSNSENTESTSEDKRQSTNTYNRTNQQDSNYTKGTTNGKTEDNSIRGLNGLFTTQQLIKQEREIAEFNVYQWIVTKYMEELFICVF